MTTTKQKRLARELMEQQPGLKYTEALRQVLAQTDGGSRPLLSDDRLAGEMAAVTRAWRESRVAGQRALWELADHHLTEGVQCHPVWGCNAHLMLRGAGIIVLHSGRDLTPQNLRQALQLARSHPMTFHPLLSGIIQEMVGDNGDVATAIFGVTHELFELGGAIPMMESLIKDGAQTLMGSGQVEVDPDLLSWWMDQVALSYVDFMLHDRRRQVSAF